MSAQSYEPLRLFPPPTQNQTQMAWLLRAREAARRAFDAALAVPRKAAGVIGRVLHKLHLNKAASALRRLASKLFRPIAAAIVRCGASHRCDHGARQCCVVDRPALCHQSVEFPRQFVGRPKEPLFELIEERHRAFILMDGFL